jgi:hypothetical protein
VPAADRVPLVLDGRAIGARGQAGQYIAHSATVSNPSPQATTTAQMTHATHSSNLMTGNGTRVPDPAPRFGGADG